MLLKHKTPANPRITAAAFEALLKPGKDPRPRIGAMSRDQFRALLRAQRRVFCRDVGSAVFFWLEHFEEEIECYGCRPEGWGIGKDFVKIIEDLRRGHHTFTRPEDFVSTVAHDFAVIIAALTYG